MIGESRESSSLLVYYIVFAGFIRDETFNVINHI